MNERPTIVVLCGSTRFSEAFRKANLEETLNGKIVLSIGCEWHGDDALGLTEADKERLDELHLRKIDLADEVLILNVDGYVGQSTANEIRYAQEQGKRIRWLDESMPSFDEVKMKYRSTILDAIESGIEGDKEKCRAYAQLWLEKLQADGETTISKHLQHILEGRKGKVIGLAEKDEVKG